MEKWMNRPAWVEIDLRKFDSNVKLIKSRIAPGAQMLAVVKADCYGHNMRDQSRFGWLRKYEDEAFYRENRIISFNTLYEEGDYVVFSEGTVSTEEGDAHYLDFPAWAASAISGTTPLWWTNWRKQQAIPASR